MQPSHLEVTHMKTHSKHTMKWPGLVTQVTNHLVSRGQYRYYISARACRTSQVLGALYAWRKASCSRHRICSNSFCSFLQGGPESITLSQMQAQRRDNLSENFALPHDIDCPNKLLLSLSWFCSLSWPWWCSGLFLEQTQVSLNFSFLLVPIMSHVEAF